jgi:hypothetical protein
VPGAVAGVELPGRQRGVADRGRAGVPRRCGAAGQRRRGVRSGAPERQAAATRRRRRSSRTSASRSTAPTSPGTPRSRGSLDAASPTIILDAATGARVAHFAEVDANALPGDPTRQALYLRPTTRLSRRPPLHRRGHQRAARRGRHGASTCRPGSPRSSAAPSPITRASRRCARATTSMFAKLTPPAGVTGAAPARVGVHHRRRRRAPPRSAGDTRRGRRRAGRRRRQPRCCTTSSSSWIRAPGIARRVEFTFDAPNVRDENGLLRDAAGNPEVRGTTLARGIALVPSCATAAAPAPITVFGHGFFGGIEETGGGYLQSFAIRSCRIIIGTDWRGMALPRLGRRADRARQPRSRVRLRRAHRAGHDRRRGAGGAGVDAARRSDPGRRRRRVGRRHQRRRDLLRHLPGPHPRQHAVRDRSAR